MAHTTPEQNQHQQLIETAADWLEEKTGHPVAAFTPDVDLVDELDFDEADVLELTLAVACRNGAALRLIDSTPRAIHAVRTVNQVAKLLAPAVKSLAGTASPPSPLSASAVPGAAEMLDVTACAEAALPMPLLNCEGTAQQFGRLQGESQKEAIESILVRLTEFVGDRVYSMPELRDALARRDEYFGETELEELDGIAGACGVPVEAILALNLGLYPEYIPGCAQFAVTRERNPSIGMLHCVNEDSPISLILGRRLTRVAQVRFPKGGIPYLTFGIAGQVGGLNGINARGLAVSTTILLDRPRRETTAVGVIHPVIVKRVLERAETIEQAVEVVRGVRRTGAWSLCFSHHPTDRICYLEYDGDSLRVSTECPTVVTTNHCMLHDPLVRVPQHSLYRLNRMQSLLKLESNRQLTVEWARRILRDRYDFQRGRETVHPTMNTIRRQDNQGSIVMRPAEQELWLTCGPMSGGNDDHYYRLDLKALFDGGERKTSQAASILL